MVKINGLEKEVAGMTLAAYLKSAAYNTAHIAVEYNGNIIAKDAYATLILKDGDALEVVQFVGGG